MGGAPHGSGGLGLCAEEKGRGRALHLAGTGSFAIEVAEWARDAGWKLAGLIELLDPDRIGQRIGGLQVKAPSQVPPEGLAVLALGGPREPNWAILEDCGWQAATIVHPRAHVSSSARLGEGCVIAPGAVIGAETAIGAHTLVSRGALVGHHVEVGSHVSLMPGVNVGGHTHIGRGTVVGMGAVVVNSTSIGAEAVVAAGALVLKDIPRETRVQGLPAREYVR